MNIEKMPLVGQLIEMASPGEGPALPVSASTRRDNAEVAATGWGIIFTLAVGFVIATGGAPIAIDIAAGLFIKILQNMNKMHQVDRPGYRPSKGFRRLLYP